MSSGSESAFGYSGGLALRPAGLCTIIDAWTIAVMDQDMPSKPSPARGPGGRAEGGGCRLDQALEAAQPHRGAQGGIDDGDGI